MKPTTTRRRTGFAARLRKSAAILINGEPAGSESTFHHQVMDAVTGRRDWRADPTKATPWVLVCLSQWAKLAYVPTVAEQEDRHGTWTETDNPLTGLLRQDLSESAYFLKIIDSLFRHGWWAVEKVGIDGGPTDGDPVFLNPLDAGRLEPWKVDGLDRVAVWRYQDRVSRSYRYIENGALIHYGEFPSPHTPGKFISRLQALLLTVSSDYHGRRHNESLMRTSGRVDTIFNYEDATPDELKLYKEAADAMLAGAHRAGGHFHTSGVKEIKTMASSQKDLDWLEGMKLSREEIFGTYGIPLEILGLGNTTFRNKEQAKKDLWEETMVPMGSAGIMAPHIHAMPSLNKPGTRIRYRFDEVPALSENRSAKIRDFRDLVSAGVSRTESARITGLGIEVEDEEPEPPPSKSVPAGDQGRGIQPAADQRTGPAPGQAPTPPPVLRALSPGSREAIREEVWRSIVQETNKPEKQLTRTLEKYFYDQRSHVLSRLEEIAEDEIEGAKAFGPKQITKASEPPTEPELAWADLLLEGRNWNEILLSATAQQLTQVYILGAEQLDITEPDEESLQAFRRHQDKLLEKVNETTRGRLAVTRRTIEQGVEEGLPLDDIVADVERDLRNSFREAQTSRAKTIARTEVGRGLNGGRMAGMEERGVQQHEWLSSRDSVVRDQHQDLDGKKVAVGSSFVSGANLKFPHDPEASSGQTINCRCTTIPVLQEDEPGDEEPEG